MSNYIINREGAMDPANRGRGLFMNPEAAGELMGISVQGVRRMCREGRIKAVKVGKQWRINRDYLMGFMGLEES